ncbi:MAG TPA: hypothetical protein VN742_11965 [Candidatus Binataceae bacterium]|nr:hypothetical protein [Candidatus Binataceae bacterium]
MYAARAFLRARRFYEQDQDQSNARQDPEGGIHVEQRVVPAIGEAQFAWTIALIKVNPGIRGLHFSSQYGPSNSAPIQSMVA